MKDARIIQLPKFLDHRGNLSFVEAHKQIPFEIKRTYWIYDVPGGAKRGGHAFYKNQELIIALSGSFDVVLNNGFESITYSLNRSYYGLYVPEMWWRSMQNFSTNSLAVILANIPYNEEDYIRDEQQFKSLVNGRL